MITQRKGYIISDQYAIYFLTFTLVGWVDLFSRKECKEILIESLKFCQKNKGLIIYAYVVMESHMHIIVSAEKASKGLSAIVRDFKKFTSKKLLSFVKTDKRESRKNWLLVVFKYHAHYNKNNTKFQLWQQNNKPKILLHPRFSQRIINYIHDNPVRSKIVEKQEDYIFSSARNYLGRIDTALEVSILDFGVTEGYIMM